MKAFKATLLISFFAGILGHASVTATQISRFCPECTDATSAAQKATTFTPPVQCDWPNGTPEIPIPDDLVCYSTDLDVLLVNPLNGDLYAYQLRFEPLLNRHVLQTRTMSSEELQAAQTTVEIYQELATAEFGSRSGAPTGLKIGKSDTRNSMGCPEGTALDHVLNPELREWMIDELRSQWVHILGRFENRSRVSRTSGISASVAGITLSVGWSTSPPPLDDIFFAGFRFDVSEVPIDNVANSDFITFQIDDARMLDFTFLFDVEFAPNLSRAAGEEVNLLMSGQTTVDNPCVMEKLAQHEQDNPELEFRIGGPGGARFDFPELTGGGGSNLCSKRLCATVCVDGQCQCQFEVVVLTLCN